MPSMPRLHTKTASDLKEGYINFNNLKQRQNDPTFIPEQKNMYDLDPPHQRNIVHSDKWKCGILRSIFLWGDIPSCYFFEVYEDRLKIFRSLDGKQRCYAIINFMMDKFKFKKEAEKSYPSTMNNMCGKFFSQLTEEQKNTISSFELTFKIFQRPLDHIEVNDFFQHVQDSRPTSAGELLNANTSEFILQLKRIHNDLKDDPQACAIGKEQRLQNLDLLCTIAYLFKNSTVLAFNIKSPNGKHLKQWCHNQMKFCPEDEKKIYKHIKTVISTIKCVGLNLNVKKDILPISWFIIKQPNKLNTFINKFKQNGFHWPTEERGKTTDLIKIRYGHIMDSLNN